MADKTIEPLDGVSLFFLTTRTDDEGHAISYSLDVEKADDSHYEFKPEAMNALDAFLITRCTGETLVDRLRHFIASFPSSRAAELALCACVTELGLDVRQFHFDSYD